MKLCIHTPVTIASVGRADIGLWRVLFYVDGTEEQIETFVQAKWEGTPGYVTVELDVEDIMNGADSPRTVINAVGRAESALYGKEWIDVR